MVDDRNAVSLPVRSGTYIEFKSAPDHELMYKSLEAVSSGIRLLNVRSHTNDVGLSETFATIYIPNGEESIFVRKLNDYSNPERDIHRIKDGVEIVTPKNADLINSIDNIKLATLKGLWTDSADKFPDPDNPRCDWHELWITADDSESLDPHEDPQITTCKELLNSLGIVSKPNILRFPERAVFLVYANYRLLLEFLNSSEQLAELKKGQETSEYWFAESNFEQREWVEDLTRRLIINNESKVRVCILDTGVNNAHPLLSPLLEDAKCLTYDPSWGTADKVGHGTCMAGVTAYGCLTKSLIQ